MRSQYRPYVVIASDHVLLELEMDVRKSRKCDLCGLKRGVSLARQILIYIC